MGVKNIGDTVDLEKHAEAHLDDDIPDESGVNIRIINPPTGLVVRYLPELGDIVPNVKISVDEGWLARALRSNLSAYSLCLSLDGNFQACCGFGDGSSLPRLHPDTRRGAHTLRVWLGNNLRGWGRGQEPPHSPSAVATSYFMTQEGILGTGCRSVANWFLAAAPLSRRPSVRHSERAGDPWGNPGPPSGLFGKWWYGMEQRWLSLLLLSPPRLFSRGASGDEAGDDYQNGESEHGNNDDDPGDALRYTAAEGGRPQFWRYFEMDCVLTGLRGADQTVDSAVLGLAPFPVGNAGQLGTPHEFLAAEKVKLPWAAVAGFSSRRSPPPSTPTANNPGDAAAQGRPRVGEWEGPWMLKLKGERPVEAEEYREYVDAALARHAQNARRRNRVSGAEGESLQHERGRTNKRGREVTVPRVIWMFWAQGETHPSLGDRDRLCIQGWRRLNQGGEEEIEAKGERDGQYRVCGSGECHAEDGSGRQDAEREEVPLRVRQPSTTRWEVRVLNDSSVAAWAAPVVALWERGLPDGARLQHRADLLRTYLLATYGGVWADTSVLPLAPLDAWIPALEAKNANARRPRPELFFAYTFPDPTFSVDVSMIPHTFDESGTSSEALSESHLSELG